MPITFRAWRDTKLAMVGTRIEVIYQFVTCQSGKVACHLIKIVCLFRVGLIERFRSHLETKSLHLLEDVIIATEYVYIEVN